MDIHVWHTDICMYIDAYMGHINRYVHGCMHGHRHKDEHAYLHGTWISTRSIETNMHMDMYNGHAKKRTWVSIGDT